MPVNPSGTMFPFNGDTSGVVAAVGRCRGGDSLAPVSCAALFSGLLPPLPHGSHCSVHRQVSISLI